MNQLTPEPLVAIHDVSKSYRRGSQRVPVLEHITLDGSVLKVWLGCNKQLIIMDF